MYSKRVTTPNVIAHARAHFGCEPTGAQAADPLGLCHPTESHDCIDGMPLENGGDDGSAPAHWEERVLHGEMMCASASSARPSPLSHITFGLFQDSGWYTPDYDVPDPICYYASPWLQHAAIGNAPGCRGDDGKPRPGRRAVWGAGRGCAFVSGRCNADPWDGYFCSDGSPTHRACTAGRLAVGSCSLTEFDKALPVAYRYFDESPKLGGADARLDYCPIVTSFRDYSCTHPPLAAPSEEEIDRRRARGERQCHDCRCFSSSLTSEAADAQEIDQVGCFEHRCLAPERLQIRIGDSDWQDCNGHGGRITIDDFDGELACPPASELCADAADLRWPTVAHVSPSEGPTGGGTSLTITGAEFPPPDDGGPRPAVRVCDVAATDVAVISASEIRAITGAAPSDWRDETTCGVRVTLDDGPWAEAYGAFVYVGPRRSQPPIELDDGWGAGTVLSVCLRLWPYILAFALAVAIGQWAYDTAFEARQLYRLKGHADARMSARLAAASARAEASAEATRAEAAEIRAAAAHTATNGHAARISRGCASARCPPSR